MLLFLTSCIKKSSSFLHLFALFVFDNLLHTSFESFISWLRISFESFDYFMLSFWQKALYHSSIAFSFLGIFFSCSKNCHSMGCDLSIQVLEENKIIFGLRGLTIKMLFQIEKSYLFPFRSGVIRNTTRYFIFWLKKGVPVFLGRSSFPALLLIFALQISLSFFLSFFLLFSFLENFCCLIQPRFTHYWYFLRTLLYTVSNSHPVFTVQKEMFSYLGTRGVN